MGRFNLLLCFLQTNDFFSLHRATIMLNCTVLTYCCTALLHFQQVLPSLDFKVCFVLTSTSLPQERVALQDVLGSNPLLFGLFLCFLMHKKGRIQAMLLGIKSQQSTLSSSSNNRKCTAFLATQAAL